MNLPPKSSRRANDILTPDQAAELLDLLHVLAERVRALSAERDRWMERALAAEVVAAMIRIDHGVGTEDDEALLRSRWMH